LKRKYILTAKNVKAVNFNLVEDAKNQLGSGNTVTEMPTEA
jgi:hypothetical protein